MGITVFDPDERKRNNQLAFLQALQTIGTLAETGSKLKQSQSSSALNNAFLPLISNAVAQQTGTLPSAIPQGMPRLGQPSTPQASPIGMTGFNFSPGSASPFSLTFGQTPQDKAKLEQQSKQAEASERISQGLNTFKTLKKQFDSALPSELKQGQLPIFQRIEGALQKAGAKTGLIDNPQLVALSKMEIPATRMILKAMGEGARMSDQDINQMIGSLDLAGMTTKERAATVKLFFDITSSQMDKETKDMFQNDPDIMETFGQLGNKGKDLNNDNLFKGLK